MDDNPEDLSLASRPQKSQDGDTSQRQVIMRQLLSELLIINNVIEKERTHPFSSLGVIIEEVTPCSSSQQLENNLSAIKTGLKTHAQDQDLEQESAIDSDEEFNTRGEFVQNKNSLKDMFKTNMVFIKQRAQLKNSDECNSDVSTTTSTKIGSTYDSNNTSNIDGCNGDSYNGSDSKELTYNKRKCIESKYDSVTSEDDSARTTNKKTNSEIANFENTEDNEEIFRKYNRFINEDERYFKKENPRHKFLTLNNNYDRCRRKLNNSNRYYSTSNLDKFSEKENKSLVKAPLKTKRNKPKPEILCPSNVSFSCRNSYAVKTELDGTPTSHSNSKIDYNSCTIEELEERLKYFEDQVHNIQEAFTEKSDELTSCNYDPENQVTSPEDDAHDCLVWRSQLANSFNLDRSDYKSIDNSSNSIANMPVQMGHIESSPNDSGDSFKDNKSFDENYTERSAEENDAQYTGTIIVVKNSSKETCDSGLYTRSSRNKNSQNYENYDGNRSQIDEEIQEAFPKIMYPSITKTVATQITDTDWKKICYAKKEMAERGSLRLNLPNSSDDEIVSETKQKTRVIFKAKPAIINDNYSSTSTDIDTTPAFSVDRDISPTLTVINVDEDLTGCNCTCFRKIFSKK